MKDLNLIPKSQIYKKKKASKKFYSTLAVFCIFIFGITIFAAPLGIRYVLQLKADRVLSQLNETEMYGDVEKQLNLIQDLYKQREETGNTIKNLGVDMRKVLEEIEAASPDRLFVRNFSIADPSSSAPNIKLTGVCSSEDDLASFVQYLRNNPYFYQVSILSVNKAGGSQTTAAGSKSKAADAGYTFNVSLYINSGK